MLSIREEISNVTVGQPQSFRGLTLFPLFQAQAALPDSPGYDLLDLAIAGGTARVTELHESGSVPELRFENHGDLPVLLLDGQELIGAKQNRVLNLTILAPAKSTIVIPVSCVEAGRWQSISPDFKPADRVMYSRVREARVAHVTASMRSSGTRRSDQSAVWDDIAVMACNLNAESPTGAMSAIYERNALSVEEYSRTFHWQTHQRGVAFCLASGRSGMDLFDHPSTMEHFFPKLVRSYALDALEEGSADMPKQDAVRELLLRIAGAQEFTESAVGLGKDVRFTSREVTGGALWADERYVHLCAFSPSANANANGDLSSRLARPSRRRRP
jgi:hypothetical protein